MRTTLLVTDDFPPRIGGVANYYHQLCRHLPREKIFVVTPPAPEAAEFDRRQPYAIIRRELLWRGPVWPKWLATVTGLNALIHRHRITAVVVGQILPYGTATWLLSQRTRVPYWVVVHGLDVARLRGRKRALARMIMGKATGMIANSYATADIVGSYDVPKSRISVLTPGVSEPRDSRQTAKQLRERFDLINQRVLLTVGRLVKRKGHRHLLHVLPQLQKKVPTLHYVIVGDGPEYGPLERLARQLGLAQRVTFARNVSSGELAGWYELCDVFAMTPENYHDDMEGFGMVYLEANSYGKPVVATRVGGVGEAVVDGVTGVLVAPGDREALLSALERLFIDPQYAHTLGLQGHHRAASDFRWEDRAENFSELLGDS